MGMATAWAMATALDLVEDYLPTREALSRDNFLCLSTRLLLHLQRLRASSRIALRLHPIVPVSGRNWNLEKMFPFPDFSVQTRVTRPLRIT